MATPEETKETMQTETTSDNEVKETVEETTNETAVENDEATFDTIKKELEAQKDQRAPIVKITAEAKITTLRPNISVIFPQNKAPRIAPTNPAEVTNSTMELSKPKSFWKKGIAPDITPVSNPNNRPPVAAITAIT